MKKPVFTVVLIDPSPCSTDRVFVLSNVEVAKALCEQHSRNVAGGVGVITSSAGSRPGRKGKRGQVG